MRPTRSTAMRIPPGYPDQHPSWEEQIANSAEGIPPDLRVGRQPGQPHVVARAVLRETVGAAPRRRTARSDRSGLGTVDQGRARRPDEGPPAAGRSCRHHAGKVVIGWGRRDLVTVPKQAARAAALCLLADGHVSVSSCVPSLAGEQPTGGLPSSAGRAGLASSIPTITPGRGAATMRDELLITAPDRAEHDHRIDESGHEDAQRELVEPVRVMAAAGGLDRRGAGQGTPSGGGPPVSWLEPGAGDLPPGTCSRARGGQDD